MKGFIKLSSLAVILLSIVLLNSCSSRSSSGSENITGKELRNIPSDQKESEINRKVAEVRKDRKGSRKEENGSLYVHEGIDNGLKEMSTNIPDFDISLFEAADEYILNVLKNPIRINDEVKFDQSICIDPRINEIYNSEDKGLLKGYKNENIGIIEYEEVGGEYNYLFLARESKESPWKVVHNGKNYKK